MSNLSNESGTSPISADASSSDGISLSLGEPLTVQVPRELSKSIDEAIELAHKAISATSETIEDTSGMNGIRQWWEGSSLESITPSEILSFGLKLLKELFEADLRSLPDRIVVLDGENDHDLYCAYVPPPAARGLKDKDFVEREFSSNCTAQVELFRSFCAGDGVSIEQRPAALWALRAAAYSMPFVLDGWQVGRRVMADGGPTIRTVGVNSRVDSSS